MASTAQAYSRNSAAIRRAIGNAPSTTCLAWAVRPVNSRATDVGKAASRRVCGSRPGWPEQALAEAGGVVQFPGVLG